MTPNSISGTHCLLRSNIKKRGDNGSGQSIGYSVGNAKKLGWRIKKALIGVWNNWNLIWGRRTLVKRFKTKTPKCENWLCMQKQ